MQTKSRFFKMHPVKKVKNEDNGRTDHVIRVAHVNGPAMAISCRTPPLSPGVQHDNALQTVLLCFSARLRQAGGALERRR